MDRTLKQLSSADFLRTQECHESAHGFILGRSIVTNAAQHLDQDVVLRIDLKSFFPSISRSRITQELSALGLSDRLSKDLSALTTPQGKLPIGFSTSPLLSNLAFRETDEKIYDLCESSGVTYTRYVDDLTFSGTMGSVDDSLVVALKFILESENWVINEKKTRFMRRGKAQIVTGLTVSDSTRPRIPRSTKAWIRHQVHLASVYGAPTVSNFSHHSERRPWTWQQMNGLIQFVRHVEPDFGNTLLAKWRQVRLPKNASTIANEWTSLIRDSGLPAKEWYTPNYTNKDSAES